MAHEIELRARRRVARIETDGLLLLECRGVVPSEPAIDLAEVEIGARRDIGIEIGARVLRKWPRFGNLQVVEVPAGNSATNLIQQYKSSGSVEYAEPDYIGTLGDHNSPNDPSYTDGTLWGLNNTAKTAALPARTSTLLKVGIIEPTLPMLSLR